MSKKMSNRIHIFSLLVLPHKILDMSAEETSVSSQSTVVCAAVIASDFTIAFIAKDARHRDNCRLGILRSMISCTCFLYGKGAGAVSFSLGRQSGTVSAIGSRSDCRGVGIVHRDSVSPAILASGS